MYKDPRVVALKIMISFVTRGNLYGQHSYRTRQCDVVASMLRLGCRRIWQVTGAAPILDSSAYKLPGEPLKYTLEYCITKCSDIWPIIESTTLFTVALK